MLTHGHQRDIHIEIYVKAKQWLKTWLIIQRRTRKNKQETVKHRMLEMTGNYMLKSNIRQTLQRIYIQRGPYSNSHSHTHSHTD